MGIDLIMDCVLDAICFCLDNVFWILCLDNVFWILCLDNVFWILCLDNVFWILHVGMSFTEVFLSHVCCTL